MLDQRRINQIAKISGVDAKTVELVLTAEYLRFIKDLLMANKSWSLSMYGEVVPVDNDCDVFQLKLSQDLLDMIDGKPNKDILENI